MIRCSLMVAALVAAIGTGAAGALDLGAPMPEPALRMRSVDDRDVSLGDVRGGKGTLVIFTCNHCPWAKAWEERIALLGNAYQPRGIGVVAVNANDPTERPEDGFDEMVKRARARGFQFPYVVDSGSKLARAFGAERTPEAFLFGADGTLVYHGTIDDNAEDASAVRQHFLRDALEAVANGQPVERAETKALGCSIKFYEG